MTKTSAQNICGHALDNILSLCILFWTTLFEHVHVSHNMIYAVPKSLSFRLGAFGGGTFVIG